MPRGTDGRATGVDVYRCLLMFGVCYLHALTQCGYVQRGLDNILSTCVSGFVVISAWYGIRLRLSKCIRLACMTFWAVGLVWQVRLYAGLGPNSLGLVSSVLRWYKEYWFVWGYIFLMLFSPLVEVAVSGIRKDRSQAMRILLPVVFCTFIWGYSAHLPVIKN